MLLEAAIGCPFALLVIFHFPVCISTALFLLFCIEKLSLRVGFEIEEAHAEASTKGGIVQLVQKG